MSSISNASAYMGSTSMYAGSMGPNRYVWKRPSGGPSMFLDNRPRYVLCEEPKNTLFDYINSFKTTDLIAAIALVAFAAKMCYEFGYKR